MRSVWLRAGAVGLGIVALGMVAFLLRRGGPESLPYACTFHELTGLHCAGCGMTRAVHAVLEGRLLEALRLNPLGVVGLPVLALALVPWLIGWVRGRPPGWRFPIGLRGAVLLVLVIFGYTILRNLPWMPFSLLAPP